MKRYFFTLLLILSCSFTLRAQTNMGLEIGANASNLMSSGSEIAGLKFGFRFGALCNIKLIEQVCLQPAVMVSTLGGNLAGANNYISINYISIPLNIIFKFPLGYDDFLLGITPYFAKGFTAKETFNSASNSSQNINFGSNSGDLKPYDFGLGLCVGYQYEDGLIFRVGYDFGLQNIANSGTLNNTCIHIGIAYLFPAK